VTDSRVMALTIGGVASEFIVHSGHSAQESPLAIEEVRRILLDNLNEP
jgi:hypothetical protein